MNNTAWWSENLDPNLTQGDIVSTLSLSALIHPTRYLKKSNTVSNGSISWTESDEPFPDKNGKTHYLARGNDRQAIIISHSCDIDKSAKIIIVAPIASIDVLPIDHRQTVMNQTNMRLLGLVDVPGIGDAYADLRNITSVPVTVINSLSRLASMTPQAQTLLQARLVGFFTRKQF